MTLGLAILTALGLILEVFVVEEMLFSRCEYKIGCTIDALEDAILKLRHVVFPRVNLNCWNEAAEPPYPAAHPYSTSRRDFFRFRFRASACLARSFSPGFR